jgi:PIN domain nuclease of toxin-antitoxin system
MASPPTIEPFYVVDTNALIWYLKNDRKLGKHAAAIFSAAERGETRLIVSAITIAELFYANEKHGLFADFSAVYRSIKSKPYFRIVPFVAEDVLAFAANEVVPEMHDRILTVLARRLNAPLVTNDPQIGAAGLVKTAR